MIVIGMFSDEIVKIIFERGAFNSQSTMYTSLALKTYNIGILTFALEAIIVIYFFSVNRIKLPVLVGIICVIIDIVLIALMIDRFDFMAIALALVISKWIKFVTLFYFLPTGLMKGLTLKVFIQVLLALVVFSLTIFICDQYIMSVISSTTLLALSFVGCCVAAFTIYAIILHIFKIIAYKDGLQ